MSKFAIAFVLFAFCGSIGAAQTRIYIPPPGKTPKPASKPVPKELLRNVDAAGSAFIDCGFAVEREAHRTKQSVSEFARTWAKSCLAEEREYKRHGIAIDKFRGDPNPRATTEHFLREQRARWVEQYRKSKESFKELRELEAKCGPNFERCPEFFEPR